MHVTHAMWEGRTLMWRVRRFSVSLALLVVVVLAACGGGTSGQQTSTSNGFPTSAAHPTPVVRTFQGCPPTGDGGDGQLNTRKNRIDDGEGGTYHDVTLSTLLGLTWPQGIEKRQRANWSSADRAAVAQDEGVAVRTTGYILDLRHEGTESPNCHAVDSRDFHVWLAVNPGDAKSHAMVIEVTPRVRAIRAGWTDSALSALRGKQVRISGWLMMDQEHPEQVNQTRATLWEIHPIIHIEVRQNGQWTSIDS